MRVIRNYLPLLRYVIYERPLIAKIPFLPLVGTEIKITTYYYVWICNERLHYLSVNFNIRVSVVMMHGICLFLSINISSGVFDASDEKNKHRNIRQTEQNI